MPWVDPSDPFWEKERKIYYREYSQEDKENPIRFRDLHTLKYVLRSIEKYCPWYHKIYLITMGHYPDWLDINHAKIELITHEELFIDTSALPTFSSSAIEMNLVNIKELSENFIYLNDDTIIWKSLKVDRFFKNKKPVDFFYHSWVPRNKFYEYIKGKDVWIDSINNNIKLINKKITHPMISKDQRYHKSYSVKQKLNNFIYQHIYKKLSWVNHWHHPQPYNKQTLRSVYNQFKAEMIRCSHNKFRSNTDLTQYIYRYWHLITGNFEPYFHNDAIVVRPSSVKHLNHICMEIDTYINVNFICFNDQANGIDNDEFNDLSDNLSHYLEEKFSDKASFEKCR